MVDPLSSVVADVYLSKLEQDILSYSPRAKHVVLWKRYVDDVLCVCSGRCGTTPISTKFKLLPSIY